MKNFILFILLFTTVIYGSNVASRVRRNVAIGLRSGHLGHENIGFRVPDQPQNPHDPIHGPSGAPQSAGNGGWDSKIPGKESDLHNKESDDSFDDNLGDKREHKRTTTCLRECVVRAIGLAKESVDRKFVRTCRRYQQVQRCVDGCSIGRTDGQEINKLCSSSSEDTWAKHQRCYEEASEAVVELCQQSCDWNPNRSYGRKKSEFSEDCRRIGCVAQCTKETLNVHCDGAGDGLEKVIYSPFDALKKQGKLWHAFSEAINALPIECRKFITRENVHSDNGKFPF